MIQSCITNTGDTMVDTRIKGKGLVKVEWSWFTVTMEASDKFVFVVKPNSTAKAHSFSMGVMSRNCAVYLSITQSAN